MTMKKLEEFNTVKEYIDYIEQLQVEKVAKEEAEMLAREANQYWQLVVDHAEKLSLEILQISKKELGI